LGSVSFNALSMFTDSTLGVDPKIQAYEYAISSVDLCGNQSVLSSSHITIHQATPQFTPPAIYDLSWTDYQGFSISQYYILRDNNHNGNWVKIDSVLFSLSNQYTDAGINHPLPTDSALYRIEASPSMPCIASLIGPQQEAVSVKGSKSNTSERHTTNPGSSVAENAMENSIIIYPNPNHGLFTLDMKNGTPSIVTIFNVLGEEVKKLSTYKNKTEVDLSKLSEGVYYLRVVSAEQTITKKVIIE